MNYKILSICLCIALAGCVGVPTSGADTNTTTSVTDTNTTTESAEKRFDGDANANVRVYNPTTEAWNVTYMIKRDGVVILNKTRIVEQGTQWSVTEINKPGNYTFFIMEDNWNSSISTQLPRAVGDRESYIEVAEVDGEFQLRVRWEQ